MGISQQPEDHQQDMPEESKSIFVPLKGFSSNNSKKKKKAWGYGSVLIGCLIANTKACRIIKFKPFSTLLLWKEIFFVTPRRTLFKDYFTDFVIAYLNWPSGFTKCISCGRSWVSRESQLPLSRFRERLSHPRKISGPSGGELKASSHSRVK